MTRYIWFALFTLAAFLKLAAVSHYLLENISKGALLVSLSFSLLIFSLMLLMKKYHLWYGAIVSLGLSFYCWSSYLYMDYFHTPFSSYVALQTSNLSGMSESIFSQMAGWHIVFFTDLVLFSGWMVYLKWAGSHAPAALTRSVKLFAVVLAAAVLFLSLKPISMQMNGKGHLLLKKYTSDSHLSNYGVIGHQAIDWMEFLTSQQVLELSAEEKEEINALLDNEDRVTPREDPLLMPGIFEDRNLIMIQFESLQQFVIGEKVNGQEITPNLNRLVENGLSFENYYPQTAEGNSSDAELLTFNSLYPLKEGSTFFRYPAVDYPSLAKDFKDSGYSTAAFHGDEGTFWNRDAVFPFMGFDRYYDISNYRDTKKHALGMGLSDEAFFEQTAEHLMKLQQPYLSSLITLTSHTPFLLPEEEKLIDTGDVKHTALGNYFESIHYTDHYLGRFLDRLNSSGQLDETVVVIYGDHNGVFKESKSEVEEWIASDISEDQWRTEYSSVPFIVASPSLKNPLKVKDIAGQIDAAPTLRDWFGLPEHPTALGHNINRYRNEDVFLLRGDYGERIVIQPDGQVTEYEPDHLNILDVSEQLIKSNFNHSSD
ncbi:LTA synthase family protein [Halobacillus sp. A5]|uniref:LTA synthase family protein n=1 Tax=Halobacillus sp. A5 TaxID=2880263 RepID=UPI0020A61F2E|nr:LTA synthase family protein [Halobacillus sp. A5]MCP3029419.1 LTA synthase family protein [Halobacillus sp. A5]